MSKADDGFTKVYPLHWSYGILLNGEMRFPNLFRLEIHKTLYKLQFMK